ncbi:hypothetical protein Scep_005194 [Stephania cephalantha]|uniref:Uncharacterized protein n=1 Tax=Stephania cephalantha TaxID=152367 RepID=A0AAP0PX99_9MAGN
MNTIWFWGRRFASARRPDLSPSSPKIQTPYSLLCSYSLIFQVPQLSPLLFPSLPIPLPRDLLFFFFPSRLSHPSFFSSSSSFVPLLFSYPPPLRLFDPPVPSPFLFIFLFFFPIYFLLVDSTFGLLGSRRCGVDGLLFVT